MTHEQNVRAILDCHFGCVREELIDNAVKCIVDLKYEQEPCEDCISRKDTLKKFKQIYFDNDTVIRCAELILGSMPPVNPQPKTGHWIYGEHGVAMCEGYWCDKCGFFVPWDYEHKFIDFINDYHFCPKCGAKMVEPQESEE